MFVLADLVSTVEAWDRDVLHVVTCRLYHPWLDPLLLHMQEKVVAIPFTLVALGLLAIRRPRTAFRAAFACALGFGLAMLVCTPFWELLDRPRPTEVYEHTLETPEELATCASHPEALPVRKHRARSASFPSRHALTVGIFVTVLLLASRPLGVLAAFYGVFVAVGRVYGAKHWPSDVIAGVVIGVALGWVSWRLVPWLFGRVRLSHLVERPVGDGEGASG